MPAVSSTSPSNSFEQRLLDSLNTAVLVVDKCLRITYANSAAQTLLQLSGPRLLQSVASELFANDNLARTTLRDALELGQPFTRRHEYLHTLGAAQTQVDYTVSPLESDEAAVLLEMQPVDRFLRIEREEALHTAHDTSRLLVRGLAHEVKNPLGGIRGAAQLLAAELAASDLNREVRAEADELCTIIRDETDRLRNLVDRLLGPTSKPQLAELNIHEVTERVAALIEVESHAAINLQRDYDPSIPLLVADKEQLIQALLNIARNAQRELIGSAAATLILRSRIQRNYTINGVPHRVVCRIDVIDNGPGIAPEIAEKIFFPMVSGHAEGSGLGLTIAQSLVQNHGGIIECQSQPGNTQFSIYLPLVAKLPAALSR
ncbi:nitrogen regulation protein NR(II) [Porticoccaceae bacterium]|nr:nitrogen regulation protein NR(II) [Porticoccaceae bacterium]